MKSELPALSRQQLDLTLPVPAAVPMRSRRAPRPCTRERAAWWFRQMRRAIDNTAGPVRSGEPA